MRTDIVLASVNCDMKQRKYSCRSSGTAVWGGMQALDSNPASARTPASDLIFLSLAFLFYRVSVWIYPSQT